MAGAAVVTTPKIKEKSRDPQKKSRDPQRIKPLPQFSRPGSGLLEDPQKKGPPKKGPPKKDPQRLIFDHRRQLIILWRYIPQIPKNGRRCQKIDPLSHIDAQKGRPARTSERALERERADRARPPPAAVATGHPPRKRPPRSGHQGGNLERVGGGYPERAPAAATCSGTTATQPRRSRGVVTTAAPAISMHNQPVQRKRATLTDCPNNEKNLCVRLSWAATQRPQTPKMHHQPTTNPLT